MDQYKINIKNCLRKYLKKTDKENREKVLTALGIKDAALDRWLSLNDNNAPKAENLPIIAQVLHISLYEIYGITLPEELDKAIVEYTTKDE